MKIVAYPIIDQIGIIILILSLIGNVFHFSGNILSGRFKNRFIKKNYRPVTEEEYILMPPRLMHWVHLISIGALSFTGLCIRYEWLKPQLPQMKIHHYCFMVIILINLVTRFLYAFYGKTKTYKDYAFGIKDILNTPAVLKYYLFFKNDYPHISKYASLQKLTYNFFWIMVIIQGITGFMILWPNILLGWLASSFGSVELADNFFSGIHTAIMWAFIIFTNIHAYIATVEGWPLFKLIFFNVEPKETAAEH